jgi:hypothetical protein
MDRPLWLFRLGRAGIEHRVVAVQLEVVQNLLDKREVGRVPEDELGDINLYICASNSQFR